MARTTVSEINESLKDVNEELNKIGLSWHLGERYGYKAIDEHRVSGGMSRTIKTGLAAGQVSFFLDGVHEGMEIMKKTCKVDGEYMLCKIKTGGV